jgi:hypothetical protein
MRKPKILDMSIFDWVTSLLGAWLIGRFLFRLRGVLAWVAFLLFWVALGVAIHWMFGVPTMLGYYLGVSVKPKRKEC